jgi:hypothetical protein
MNMKIRLSLPAMMLCVAAHGQPTNPVIPAGKLAVFKAGTSDANFPMITARVAPVFVQVFDPVTNNQTSPELSMMMSTNASVPGSVWVNHHAGSEGGGLSRSVNRQFLVMEGYTGNILSPTASKPSTDPTVHRGIVRMDAFTNAISVYSDLVNWFGIPVGSVSGTQDNPTGIASTDGTNFWGTGNFAGTSSELDGTLFYNPNVSSPVEVQNYIQAAGEARVIGGTLYVVVPGAGVYNFVDPTSGNVIPLPFDPNVPNPYERPTFTNLFLNWGTTFQNTANFDMNPEGTIAYGADQSLGISKFINNGGGWVQAPYYFNTTNLGTTKQTSGNQGVFSLCVDFSGPNPVIYATTMENGYPTVNSKAGHQNQNRIIKVVDTGVDPGTNLVAQTLAIASTTNEFFGGIDFTPDLTPLISSNPANYATTNGGSATFSVAAQSAFPVTYQWLQDSNSLAGAAAATLTLNNLTTATNGFAYQCVVSDQYGSVTSAPAILTVTVTPVAPTITSGTNNVFGFVGGATTFAPVSATGTEPFTYQWYQSGIALVDDGANFIGSTTPSLTMSNLTTAQSGNYYLVVANSAGYASNLVDVFTVNYHTAIINAGQPQSVTTFIGLTTSLTAQETGATPPVTNQWYRGNVALTDTGEFSGSGTSTLTISPAGTSDSGTNYYIVVSNPGGSVTSSLASVTVLIPPPLSSVSYSNQIYRQNFDSLPDPGGVSVNSINNPLDSGTINGVAYSLANPFDFNYPIINNSYVGGLGLSQMQGWYGAADTLYAGVGMITRFGAQDGDQSTGGDIDFGLNDVNGGIKGTNRALGLISTATTGSTTFGLKLINTSTTNLNYVNVSFIGELWRNNTGARTMTFGYTLDNSATNFALTAQSISNATLVPEMAFSFPTAIVVTTVDGTQASNQVDQVTNNLALSAPWPAGGALWLIWSINYYGSGGGQGYAIDNFNFSSTVNPTPAPTVTTMSAANVTAGTAQLSASVNPNTAATAYWFQYGTTTNYGSVTPVTVLAAGASPVTVSNLVSALLQNTTYHYQIVASNFVGTSYGSDSAFTTLAVTPPRVGVAAVTNKSVVLRFTNAPGAGFSVLGTNNPAAPVATWPVVGHTVESPAGSGIYLFTNAPSTNAMRFFILRQP